MSDSMELSSNGGIVASRAAVLKRAHILEGRENALVYTWPPDIAVLDDLVLLLLMFKMYFIKVLPSPSCAVHPHTICLMHFDAS